MKRYLKFITTVILLVIANVAVFSQGVLIFEVSDTINAPLVGAAITLNGKSPETGNDTILSFRTDKEGRVVVTSCPVGTYSYQIDYGDYNTGECVVTQGEYTWIDLDFRNVNIRSTEKDGVTPKVDKAVYVSLKSNGEYVKVSEKRTDKDGRVKFILPKGTYRYTANGKNSADFEVNDKNIDFGAKASGGLITHKVFFHFIREDSTDYEVKALKVSLYQFDNNRLISDAKVCQDKDKDVSMDGDYFIISETRNPVSANEDVKYKYKLETKDFGDLIDTFTFGEETDVNRSVVYIVITDEMIERANKGGSGGGGKSNDDDDDDDDMPGKCIQHNETKVAVRVVSARDSITPLSDIPIRVRWVGTECYANSRHWYKTDMDGMFYYTGGDSLNILDIGNETLTFVSNKDTSVVYYMDDPNFADVNFRFFVREIEFNPESVKKITIYKDDTEMLTIYGKPKVEGLDTTYVYDEPVRLMEGEYVYDYTIKEKNYDERVRKVFRIGKTDTVVYVDKVLEKSYRVEMVVTDYDQNVAPNAYIHLKSSNGDRGLLADKNGKLVQYYFTGDYVFSAFGIEYKLDSLCNDTTLYFQMKNKSIITKFQFLHDGKPVYPEITHLDISKLPENELYARSISTYYPNHSSYGRSWVFEDTVKLEKNEYRLVYSLDDYELKGYFQYDFEIFDPVASDTVIYVVIPTKRNVSITVLDGNGLTISNMHGAIYKYDSDGTLSSELQYDSKDHNVKSSSDGIVLDRLLPGRYQLQLNDIVRDFVVSDYDVSFVVQSGLEMFNVNYVVMTETTKTPLNKIRIDINKGNETYGNFYTDTEGKIYTICEEADYTYALNYADKGGSVYVNADTTITVLVPEPVAVTEISIADCPCLIFGDTLKLNPIVSPSSATMKGVEWSINNPGVARILENGTLIANNFGYEAYAVVTASAIDGSGMKGEFVIRVGKTCQSDSLSLTAGEEGLVETAIGSDSLLLTAKSNDDFRRYYIFQSSSDSINWKNVVGPTRDNEVTIPTADYTSGSHFFRVVSATSVSDAETVAKGGNVSCPTMAVSNLVKTYSFNIYKMPWPEVVCETNGKVSLKIDASKATDLPEGTTIRWYKKSVSDSAFTYVKGSEGKDSIDLDVVDETSVKATITANGVDLQTISGLIKVDRVAKFSIEASKDTLCDSTDVTLSVIASEGKIGNVVWNNDSTGNSITLPAHEGFYKAIVSSVFGVCPASEDSISLTIDYPAEIEIESDHVALCSDAKEPVKLTVVNADKFVWADGNTERTISVAPTETETYSATAESKYGLCKSVSAEKTIYVSGPVSVALDVTATDICQTGSDSITLSAHVVSGVSEEFIWWDGLKTLDSVRTIKPDSSIRVWAAASNNVCGASSADTIDVAVAKPTDVTFYTADTIFEYGKPIVFNATTDGMVYGPYKWVAIDKDGNETELSVGADSSFTYMPSADADYYVEISNGACALITSPRITTKLVDNIIIPTVFTPHELNGENDDFMPGYSVIIYDRYGNIVCDSDKGWDGTYKDKTADAGVYFYVLTLKDGRVKKGTIEVYRN